MERTPEVVSKPENVRKIRIDDLKANEQPTVAFELTSEQLRLVSAALRSGPTCSPCGPDC